MVYSVADFERVRLNEARVVLFVKPSDNRFERVGDEAVLVVPYFCFELFVYERKTIGFAYGAEQDLVYRRDVRLVGAHFCVELTCMPVHLVQLVAVHPAHALMVFCRVRNLTYFAYASRDAFFEDKKLVGVLLLERLELFGRPSSCEAFRLMKVSVGQKLDRVACVLVLDANFRFDDAEHHMARQYPFGKVFRVDGRRV